MLSDADGKKIIERGVGAFETSKENVFQILRKSIDGGNVINEEKLSIKIVNSTRNLGEITDFGIVLQNRILVEASEIGPMKRHLEIRLPKRANISY